MPKRIFLYLALAFTLFIPPTPQQRLLTIDDIFDPEKRINFTGTVPTTRWLKDGQHYLLASESATTGGLQKVNAATGEATPLFDAAKMRAAFSALPGITQEDAKQLSTRTSYLMNSMESAVLIDFVNDLFYYQLNSDRATRLTNDPEAEVGETFSPDGRMVGFVRANNIHVIDLGSGNERRLTTDGGPKIYNGRLDWVYQEELYGRGRDKKCKRECEIQEYSFGQAAAPESNLISSAWRQQSSYNWS